MLADALGHRRRGPDPRPHILEGDLGRGDAEEGDRKNEIGRLRNATDYSHLNAHAHARSYIWSRFRRRRGPTPNQLRHRPSPENARIPPRNRTLIAPNHATR